MNTSIAFIIFFLPTPKAKNKRKES
jgi:hypothetical protein